jgi:hypothetical protein
VADYFEECDVRNGLLASAYHVTQLVTLYVEVAQLFESLLHLLWKHYGSGRRPNTFPRMLETPQDIPSDYHTMLRNSWTAHGRNLNDYRNCLIHHDPLDDGGKTAWTNCWSGRWGTTVRLPANPRARKRESFDFDNGPDVLSLDGHLGSGAGGQQDLDQSFDDRRHAANHP